VIADLELQRLAEVHGAAPASTQLTLHLVLKTENPRSRAYVALALLAASRDLRSRLGRCAFSECGVYFLDDTSRGGKRRLYCCPEHSDIGRTRLYRERLRAKATKRRKAK
jgi:hypothetical protein